MVNSHYVPQFILRGFCKDNNLFYCSISQKSIEKRNTRSVFSEVGYYPDTIEKDLCKKAEYLFANLFHNKIENAKNSITLTADELFVLKKYLIVSSIRYRYEMTDEESAMADKLDDSFKPAFIENLNFILNCNNIEDMVRYLGKFYDNFDKAWLNPDSNIDEDDINYALWAEIKDILQSYIIFARPQGNEKFIISDIGKAIYEGPMSRRKIGGTLEVAYKQGNPDLLQLCRMLTPHDYTIFPLTENLAVISMSTFFKLFTDSEFHYNVILPDDCKTVSSMLGFGDRNTIVPPKVKFNRGSKEYHYSVQRINESDVSHFNCLLMAEAKNYLAFSSLDNVNKTLKTVNKYSNKDLSFINKEAVR